MDLVVGDVVHGRLPIRPSRFRLLLGLLPFTTAAVSAAFSGCPCPPIIRRNAPAVVPFAKKKRKGYSEDPPDEEVSDDFTDELEEDEEVEEEEDFDAEEEEGGNGFCELGDVCFICYYDGWEFPVVFLWDDWGFWTLHFAPFLGSPYLTVGTVMHFPPLKFY